MDPAGVAYVACQNTMVSGGDVVVIFGAGPIGLFCAMLCELVFGAAEIHVVEPLKFRRDFASQWCDEVHDLEAFLGSPPRRVDVLIEASGEMSNVTRLFHR
jgi:threonine dehydrogenase-like Zn-dependent dehydrogenase